MQLTVIGSGSSGNCYLMDSGKEVLIIEAGISLAKVKKALGFDLSRVVGCLVTHEHGDHAKYAADYSKAGIYICSSPRTIKALGIDRYKAFPMELFRMWSIGSFEVAPFDVVHDAAEPVGFIIEHPEMGRALFVTDTHFIRYRMEGIDQVIIEANFSDEILDANVEKRSIHPKLADRIRSSHMSIGFVEEFIELNDLKPQNTVLIHLSDSNSHAAEFKQRVESLVDGNVYIAESGLTVNLDKYPF